MNNHYHTLIPTRELSINTLLEAFINIQTQKYMYIILISICIHIVSFYHLVWLCIYNELKSLTKLYNILNTHIQNLKTHMLIKF